MENKLEYIRNIFGLAKINGLCKNQREFAEAIGISRSSLSQALAGIDAYLTESLVNKIRLFAKDNGLEITKAAQAQQAHGPGVFIPEETRAMFDNMAETIRIQAQMLAQFQGAGMLPGSFVGAPKNYRIDGK